MNTVAPKPRTKPKRACSICQATLSARMIRRVSVPVAGQRLQAVLFAKSLPVLECDVCDRADPLNRWRQPV